MVKKSNRIGATKLNEQPVSPIDALVRRLDLVAVEMETGWGCGVLNTLCTPDTSAKFMRVKLALDDAIQSGDYDTVKAKSESLIRGWQQMEKEVMDAGHKKGHIPNISFVCSPKDGIEYIICQNELDASRAAAQYPARASVVFTLADIARMIENGSVVNLSDRHKEIIIDQAKKAKKDTEEFLQDIIPF